MRKFNWAILVTAVTAAVLYIHGLVAITEQAIYLHTAGLPTPAMNYRDIVVRGYWVFVTILLRPLYFPYVKRYRLDVLVVLLLFYLTFIWSARVILAID